MMSQKYSAASKLVRCKGEINSMHTVIVGNGSTNLKVIGAKALHICHPQLCIRPECGLLAYIKIFCTDDIVAPSMCSPGFHLGLTNEPIRRNVRCNSRVQCAVPLQDNMRNHNKCINEITSLEEDCECLLLCVLRRIHSNDIACETAVAWERWVGLHATIELY